AAADPPGLLGDAPATTPQDLLLAGLNACMTAGIVATAAARGIALTSLRIRTSGQLDLRGYLGLDPGVNPGYDRVDVHIQATSPAAGADLHAAITDAVRHSPTFTNFRRALSVTPTITTATDADP